MLEDLIAYVQSLDDTTIYLFLFVIAYLENVVPPIPGDLPVAFVGSILATRELSFSLCLIFSTTGSLFGFFTMYSIGRMIGTRIYIDTGGALRHKWAELTKKVFPPEQFETLRGQFERYGYLLILANRFLTGSRSIISIFSGISRLNIIAVHLCALISAAIWNVLLLYGGLLLGKNWERLGEYLSTYGIGLTILVVAVITVAVWRAVRKKSMTKNKSLND